MNIRGSDIQFNPLAYSYLFVTMDEIHLFIDARKVDDKARKHFSESKVTLHPYEEVYNYLKSYLNKKIEAKETCMVHMATETNFAIGSIFGDAHSVIETSIAQVFRPSTSAVFLTIILQTAKVVKNSIELAGMRASHVSHS